MPYQLVTQTKSYDWCFRNASNQKRSKFNYPPVTIKAQKLQPIKNSPLINCGDRPIYAGGVIIPKLRVGKHTNPNPQANWITVGEWDTDKGHIFALELGGPNFSENVVPQWSTMNQRQKWREYERYLKKIAKALIDNDTKTLAEYSLTLKMPYDHIYYEVFVSYVGFTNDIIYTTNINRWGYPKQWKMVATFCDKTGKNKEKTFLNKTFTGNPWS